MEARFAALEAENKSLRDRIEALEQRAAAKPTRTKKEPVPTGPMDRKEVNWSLIPKGSELLFSLENKAGVVALEHATFTDNKTIVPKDKRLLPKDKPFLGSINAWATACLKKHLAALGRKTATVNVYDRNSGISFKNSEGAFVSLSTIQTIVRTTLATPPPAPEATSATMVGGGGSVPAPVEAAEDIPASQDSQMGNDCWRCKNFVADGEVCDCEPVICLCGTVVAKDDHMGVCVECEQHLCLACGIQDGEDNICQPCAAKTKNEDIDLEDMDLKDIKMLFNPITKEVFVMKPDGLPGAKISTLVEGKHVWVWNKKKIGGTFYQVNHFNYVKQTATAGGAWVGMYNPATETLTPTPAQEDF